MKRLCTICARGGSKGLPNKNLRPLLEKPLIVHTIERARESGIFDCIAVSSESREILAVAEANGVDYPIERPPELAADTASKLPAILHAMLAVEAKRGLRYDTLVDLDATSPLRLAQDIRGAVDLLERNRVSSVITGATSHRSPYFNLVEEMADGSVRLAKPLEGAPYRRQDVPPTFDMDASIYVWDAAVFRHDQKVFYPDTRLFKMPVERARDIDSDLDFEIVELMMRGRARADRTRKPRFDLSGKVAVVTGGAGIIGHQCVRGLAEHGAAVAIIDIDRSRADQLATGLRAEQGARAMAVDCDISDPGKLRAAVDRIEGKLGPIDVLHNNAATKGSNLEAFFAPVEEFDLATWREIMAVNLDAMFLVAKEIGSRMVKRRRGSIVQTASIYGALGPDPRIYDGSEYCGRPINTPPVYAASKAGVIGLTRYLATLWAPANVRVNTLVPGGVESGQNEVFSRKYSDRVPLGRMARADEMVGPLIFLASDSSSYVTGQTLMVDGGLSAW
jgi:NAD(P)-dependent dehydrogenase (short-subunit alcohol dehydrogenase family)/CMP-N-acetylneuraminic acid synthetase